MVKKYLSYLSIQSDGLGLAFGTNTSRPRRVASAARFNATANVFQIGELATI